MTVVSSRRKFLKIDDGFRKATTIGDISEGKYGECADASEYKVLEPDEDFYRAITKDELLKGIYEDIDIFFANK
jgi:hypothetical protein